MMHRKGIKKHWDVFEAWVNGAEVEFYSKSKGEWVRCRRPIFAPDGEYRVKEETK